MTNPDPIRCTAFDGDRRVASGTLADVARAVKRVVERGEHGPLLVFDDGTSQPIELDLRGTVEDVLRRVTPSDVEQRSGASPAPGTRRGPGRPRLGVVSREVTLLPRHWAWLAAQRGGASGALRKLVDSARRADIDGDQARRAQDATYRFGSAMAGNQPGFEEAMRALFAGDAERFDAETGKWPDDIRDHARALSRPAFADAAAHSADAESR